MSTSNCAKCQSSQVFRLPVYFKSDNQPMTFAVFNKNQPIVLHPRPQVCRSCGSVEMYLDAEELAQLAAIPEANGNWVR